MNIYDACVNRARAAPRAAARPPSVSASHRTTNKRFSGELHNGTAALAHLLQAVHEALPLDPLQPVPADVEVDEPEAGLHVVVVAQLLDAVVPQVEPQERLGDEGVVEPLQQVVRHVQPLQVVLRVQQSVQLLQPVVVQSEGLKVEWSG